MARIRAWTDFASDLLDAHIWGFSAGDWQAAVGLAHALEGSDWPPDWKRDLDNPACIIVDPSVWPTPGLPDRTRSGKGLTGAHLDWLANVAERGFDPTKFRT